MAMGLELTVRGLFSLVLSTLRLQVGGLRARRLPGAAVRAGAGRVPELGRLERQHGLPRGAPHLLPARALRRESQGGLSPAGGLGNGMSRASDSHITSSSHATRPSLPSLSLSFFILEWGHSACVMGKKNA